MANRSPTLFDRWSSTYDADGLQTLTYRPIHDAVLARLKGEEPKVILDLGCGTGQLTRRLIGRFPASLVVGVDYSAGMLAEAAERLPTATPAGIALLRADAQHLGFRENSVDVIVCTESFHWYEDQPGALAGLAKILRPGGRLVIASIATTSKFGHDVVRRTTAASGQPIRALPPRQLRSLLQRTGFDVIHQRRIPRLGLVPWPVLTDSIRG